MASGSNKKEKKKDDKTVEVVLLPVSVKISVYESDCYRTFLFLSVV